MYINVSGRKGVLRCESDLLCPLEIPRWPFSGKTFPVLLWGIDSNDTLTILEWEKNKVKRFGSIEVFIFQNVLKRLTFIRYLTRHAMRGKHRCVTTRLGFVTMFHSDTEHIAFLIEVHNLKFRWKCFPLEYSS